MLAKYSEDEKPEPRARDLQRFTKRFANIRLGKALSTHKNEKKMTALMHRNFGIGFIGLSSVCKQEYVGQLMEHSHYSNSNKPYSLDKITQGNT